MKDEIAQIIHTVDIRNWKRLEVAFGDNPLTISVPPDCVLLNMKKMPALAHSRDEILRALQHPLGSPTLEEILRSKDKPVDELTVCVTVSDITRPVPYKGEQGILLPLFEIIERTGVMREHIVIVVGNGMHRPSTQ